MKHDGSEQLSGEHPVGFMAPFSSKKPRGRVVSTHPEELSSYR
jgi:hypothetical protein